MSSFSSRVRDIIGTAAGGCVVIVYIAIATITLIVIYGIIIG